MKILETMDTIGDKMFDVIIYLWYLYMLLIPIQFIWSVFHSVKCIRVKNCKKRKCSYWNYCVHNYEARELDDLLWRIEMAEIICEEDLSDLKEQVKEQIREQE